MKSSTTPRHVYHVTANACDWGLIEAADEQEARDTAARIAGYASEADMAAQLDSPSEIDCRLICDGPIPERAVAWKYSDPTEVARWVLSRDEVYEISGEDPSLLVFVRRIETPTTRAPAEAEAARPRIPYYYETDGGDCGYLYAPDLDAARGEFRALHPDVAPESADVWAPSDAGHPLHDLIREFRDQVRRAQKEFPGWEDWTMVFTDHEGTEYYPTYLAETDGMPDEVVRQATDYDERARRSAKVAADRAQHALAHLDAWDLDACESAIEDAVIEEAEFGAATGYGPLTQILREIRSALEQD